ncbi:MAG: hypothetical protein PW734_12395 [Verrucomicrobium sp.]|nr:hypothetical protein [Verrucomicrobium sp.]
MKAHFAEGMLALEFENSEKELLILSLVETFNMYEIDPAQLPERLQRYWTGLLSTRQAQDADLEEAASDLRDTRLAWRSDRAKLLEQWLGAEGNLTGEGDDLFTLDDDEIEAFLAILNERRLLLAALNGIGETQMDVNPAALPTREMQRAVWEIHFLAYVMENCLAALSDGGSES